MDGCNCVWTRFTPSEEWEACMGLLVWGCVRGMSLGWEGCVWGVGVLFHLVCLLPGGGGGTGRGVSANMRTGGECLGRLGLASSSDGIRRVLLPTGLDWAGLRYMCSVREPHGSGRITFCDIGLWVHFCSEMHR